MSDIKFKCPHCQQHLEAPEDMLGEVVNCPSCQQPIQLPVPNAPAVPLLTHDSAAPRWWKRLFRGNKSGSDGDPSAVPEAYAAKVATVDLNTITSVQAVNDLGNTLLASGNLEMAVKVFEKGTTLAPNHVGVMFNLAIAYRLSGKFQTAEALCKKLLSMNPSDWDAKAELAACQKRESDGSKEYEASRRAFLESWKKDAAEFPQTSVSEQAKQSAKDAAFREKFTSSIVGALETPEAKTAAQELLSNTEFKDFRSDQAAKFEQEAMAGISLGADMDSLVQELIHIGSTDGFLGRSGGKYDENGWHKRVREIGEMLSAKGGFALMQAVGYRVQVHREIPRGLEHCWTGIGSWQA